MKKKGIVIATFLGATAIGLGILGYFQREALKKNILSLRKSLDSLRHPEVSDE